MMADWTLVLILLVFLSFGCLVGYGIYRLGTWLWKYMKDQEK